jgi:hypothetical protein
MNLSIQFVHSLLIVIIIKVYCPIESPGQSVGSVQITVCKAMISTSSWNENGVYQYGPVKMKNFLSWGEKMLSRRVV